MRVYTVQIGNGDDVDVQTGTDLFGQPVYERKHFPVNPELLSTMAKDTGGESFIATDKSGAREEHALDPRPPREDAVRVAGVDDGGPLPAAARARRRCSLALEALVRLVLVRRFP